MKNIAILCHPTYGGSGIIATELGVYLSRKSYTVHFLSHEKPVRCNELNPNIFFHQVTPYNYPLFRYKPYELALSCKIYQVVKKFDISIIHSHYAIPHAFAAYMAKQMLKQEGTDIKIITTLHGTDITLVGKKPSYKTGVEFGINQSHAVTCVSEALKKETLSVFNIKKNIDVIPNFVSHPKNIKPEPNLPNHQPTIAHTSNFRKVKRIMDVIEIFKQIHTEIPEAKLILAGEGPEKEKAQERVQHLSLERSVYFYGYVENVETILNSSDIFLLPSENESFGLAALEAMNYRNAIISSNTGGLPEVNLCGKTGFLHEVGDTQNMSQSAIKLLQNKNRLKEFQQNAFNIAQKFNIEKILPKYEMLYKKLLLDCHPSS